MAEATAPSLQSPDADAARAALRLSLIVAGAMFMENLDGTVIVTALPQMAKSFHVTATDLSLGVTAYMLTVASFIPISGWAADRFGSRNVFGGAVALFTIASILCGLSATVTAFVAARVLQGFAAALMSPVGRLVVIRNTPKARLMGAIAILVWPALFAPVLGPPLGGLISTYTSWRWIFFLNVPLGVAGAALAYAYVPQQKGATRRPFDSFGFATLALSLGSLVYGFDLLSRSDANPPLAAGLIVAGLASGAVSVRHAAKAAHPLLDLKCLTVPSFTLATVSSGSLVRVAISATPFLLPLMFQIAYGLTPVEAGLLVLVYMGGNLMTKTITTPVLRRFGFRTVLVATGVLNALAILACGFGAPGAAMPFTLVVLFFAGGVRSMSFTAINTLTFAEVAPEQRSGATALQGTSQQVAFSLGVAIAAVALNSSLALRGGHVLGVADFRFAFIAMAVLALVSAAWFARLHPAAGAEVSGHKPRAAG